MNTKEESGVGNRKSEAQWQEHKESSYVDGFEFRFGHMLHGGVEVKPDTET